MKRTLKPEFLNRIDEVIMFLPLNLIDVKKIVQLQLNGLQKLLEEQNIKVTIEEHIVAKLAELGYDPQFGARPVKRVIQKEILNKLSKDLLAGKVQRGAEIILDEFDGEFVFRNAKIMPEKV